MSTLKKNGSKKVFLFTLTYLVSKYNLGVETINEENYDLILQSLIRLKEVFKSDIVNRNLVLESIKNDFQGYINDVPLLIFNLSLNNIDIDLIISIFKRLLEASAKTPVSDRKELLIYEGTDFSRVYEYEKVLWKLWGDKRKEEFLDLYLDYIDYYLNLYPCGQFLELAVGDIKKVKEMFYIIGIGLSQNCDNDRFR